MRTLPVLLALMLALLGATRRTQAEEPYTEPEDDLAHAVVEAYADGGSDAVDALATVERLRDIDPFRVAERLWMRDADDMNAHRAGLAAARAWAVAAAKRPAGASLAELVERWAALDAEDASRLLRLRAAYVALKRELQARTTDWATVGHITERARPDIEAAPWSVTAVDLGSYAIVVLGRAGRTADAIVEDQALVERCLALGWRRAAASLLGRIASSQFELGRLDEALHTLARSRAYYEALDRQPDAAATLVTEARVDMRRNDLDAAEQKLQHARKLMEASHAHRQLPPVLTQLGHIARARGRKEQALAAYTRMLEVCRDLGDDEGIVIGLANCANIHSDTYNHEQARALLEQAIAHAQATGALSAHHIDGLRLNLAGLLGILGQHDGVIATCRRIIASQRATQDKARLPHALECLGTELKNSGRFAEALVACEEALAIYRERQDSHKMVQVLRRLAAVCAPTGRIDAARHYVEAALALARASGSRDLVGLVLADAAAVEASAGQFERARDLLEECWPCAEASEDAGLMHHVVTLLGNVLVHLEEHERALGLLERSLAASRTRGHVHMQVDALKSLAISHWRQGQPEAAFPYLDQAEALARRIASPPLIADVLRLRCQNQFQLGKYAEAVASAQEAVELRLNMARGLGDSEAVALGDATRMVTDYGLDAMLRWMEAGEANRERLERAFWFAEAGRSLALLEGILNRDALRDGSVPAELRTAEAQARDAVRRAHRALAAEAGRETFDEERLAALRAALDDAYRTLDDALARVARAQRRSSGLADPRPVPLEKLQAGLPEDTAFLGYQIMTEGQTVLFLVTRKEARLIRLGNSKPVIEAALAWHRLLAAPGTDERAAARALADRILAPLAKVADLSAWRRLVIAPDGVLAVLPFEGLIHGEGEGRRVIETHEVLNVPSASVFAALEPQPAGLGLLALGDPVYPGETKQDPPAQLAQRGLGNLARLPATGEEVRAIAALYPDKHTLLVRQAATRSALEDALARAPARLAALHLACHGVLDTERPLLTGLVLSEGEILTVADVHRLEVPADLVVLSACETGLGRLTQAEGILGLTRGFLFAGALRVVVSNWKVSDEHTKDLMLRLYEGLCIQGLPPAEALRGAKLALVAAGHAHPYHWASFTLWGAL